jgi:LmbE family N-acetylglucosaminyl deacetylase
MNKRRILAVGAHPDDVELGCGGVLVKHLDLGDEVHVLVMTNGDKGNHTMNREECLASLDSLGVKKENIFFGNFPDGFLRDDFNTVSLIESYIKKLNITRVYTHSPSDRHQDHRSCSLSVSSAARNISEIFLFQGPSTKAPFDPHYFIEISEKQLGKKLKALGNYKTQIAKGIVNVQAIDCLARLNGAHHKTDCAEAFALNHALKRGKDV